MSQQSARKAFLALSVLVAVGWCGPTRQSLAAAPARDRAAVAQAQERFRRGLTLYEEGNTAGALVELQRAYDLSPSFKILYNLGQIAAQARDHAAALNYFRRYLTDGGSAIPAARRREVEQELRFLKERTGTIDIQVADAGAAIAVDDEPLGDSPLAGPVRVNVGRHRVEVTLVSGRRLNRSVDVAGEENITVRFETPVAAVAAEARANTSPAPEPTTPPPVLAPGPEAPAPSLLAPDPEKTTPAPSLLAPDPEKTTPAAPPPGEPAQRHGRRSAWLSWGLTGALAVAAGVTGGLAVRRSGQADEALDSFPASPSTVDDLRSDQHKLALASDGFLIGTLLMAGVSTYLSLSKAEEPARGAGDVAYKK